MANLCTECLVNLCSNDYGDTKCTVKMQKLNLKYCDIDCHLNLICLL